jgi:plastocyanin
MIQGRTIIGFALAALATGVPAAHADETISAIPPNQYAQTDVTIDQGEKVTFSNNDTVDHDVTARDKGPDGNALFASELIGTAQSSLVKGTEYLTTGEYAFVCSLHPQMTGTLRVTTAGTPTPRPGSPGTGQGGGAPAPAADTTAPVVSAKVTDSKVRAARRRGGVRLSVTLDEPGSVALVLKRGRKTVASATVAFDAAGTKTVTARFTKAGRRLAKRKRMKLSLSATATDAAGNNGSGSDSRTLRGRR